MRFRARRGFIIILVTVSLAVLILSAATIVIVGCSELIATRVRNDLLVSAYYVAISGAELMYSDFKTKDTVSWSPAPSMSGSISVGTTTVGTYAAYAYKVSEESGQGIFAIVSSGTVSGHTATVTVQYGFRYNESVQLKGPIPLGSGGAMNLTGASGPAKLIIDGPVMTNDSSVGENGSVTVSNGAVTDASIPPVMYAYHNDGSARFDTNGTRHADYFDVNNDGSYAEDTNNDGVVTRAEAVAQGKEAAFDADKVYNPSNDQIGDLDIFYHYYTIQLTSADFTYNSHHADLGIAPGGTHFYSGDKTFNKGDIDNSVPIVFVDGNVTITYNDQDWTGSSTLNHTIVATGTISIEQPTNRPGDTLTLVSYGDIFTTGTMGDKGSTIGNLVIVTSGNFTAEDGGKMHASIFANGSCTINTIGDDAGKDHRVINLLTITWDTPADAPLGLPKSYPANKDLNTNFAVMNSSEFNPIWQRT